MAIALAFVVAIRIWFNPRGWVLAVLLVGWAALNAYFLARSVRQNITRLQASTAAIPDRYVGVVDPSYSDFDDLARAISVASDPVERALNGASETRRELQALIATIQDPAL